MIEYTCIVVRFTGALVKCKSNDKESVRDYFSKPRQYTLSILSSTQSKIVFGVAAYSKISMQECFH